MNTHRLVTTAFGRKIHATTGTTGRTFCGRSCTMPAYTAAATCRTCARYVAALRAEQHAATDDARPDAEPAARAADTPANDFATPDDTPAIAPASAYCESADDAGTLCANRANVLTVYGAMCWPHAELSVMEHPDEPAMPLTREDGRA